MPAAVKRVRWICTQCGKKLWLKPWDAQTREYCSRACHYLSMRVVDPVRSKQGTKPSYEGFVCTECKQPFTAKAKHQKYCSRDCQLKAIHAARIDATIEERPCEHCGKPFRPRPNNSGRFCSRPCYFAGARGSKAGHWKGGRHITDEGYVKVSCPGHPAAHGKGSYVSEHRLVLEKMLGRYLLPNETPHHKNGNRADNRPENLELWVKPQPPGQRAEDLVAYAKEILAMYEPDLEKLKQP